MKKAYLLLVILTLFTLTGCKKAPVTDGFVLVPPEDTPVILNELPYSTYLSLNNPVVTITIQGIGDIKLQLFPTVAPNTVNSFILYAQNGSYDGIEFHRIVSEFVIQGGKLNNACEIPGEMTSEYSDNTLLHYRGVISMARIGDLLDSASSQFFIVQRDANNLDGDYAGFGGIVDGFEVLDYIASLKDENYDIAIVPIIIESMTVELNGYETADRICVE